MHKDEIVNVTYWVDNQDDNITIQIQPDQKVEYELIQLYTEEVYLHKQKGANIAKITIDGNIVYQINLTTIKQEYDGYVTDYKYTVNTQPNNYKEVLISYYSHQKSYYQFDDDIQMVESERLIKQELWICGKANIFDTSEQPIIVDDQSDIIIENNEFTLTQQDTYCTIYIKNPTNILINNTQTSIDHIRFLPINTIVQYNNEIYTCIDKTNKDWQVGKDQIDICITELQDWEYSNVSVLFALNENYHNFELLEDNLKNTVCHKLSEIDQYITQSNQNNIIYAINNLNDLPIRFNLKNFTILNYLQNYDLVYYDSYANIEFQEKDTQIQQKKFVFNNVIYNQYVYFINKRDQQIDIVDHIVFNGTESNASILINVEENQYNCTTLNFDHYQYKYTCDGQQIEKQDENIIKQQRYANLTLFYENQEQKLSYQLSDELNIPKPSRKYKLQVNDYIIIISSSVSVVILYTILMVSLKCHSKKKDQKDIELSKQTK